MNEMQNKLFNSLLEYWQLIINKLTKELTIAYPGSSGNTKHHASRSMAHSCVRQQGCAI